MADALEALAGRGSGAFVSFMGADDPESVAACYPPDTLSRPAPAGGVDTTD